MSTSTNNNTSPLASRGLKPIAQLAAGRDHGDRLRYMAGCRCVDCKRANSAYESSRQKARAAGLGNGIVSADRARAHLLQLSAQGVGRRSVNAASDVAESVLQDIASGRKHQIRAATERKILAVTKDCAGDGSLVPAKATWKLLDQLLADGYTKSTLARELGYSSRALQLKKDKVTLRNAHQVHRLFEKLKFTSAAGTTRRLQKLREEGFTMGQIEQRVSALASTLGEDKPSLEVRNGRIRARARELIEKLYAQLTQ